jgi:ribosomal protein L11 methyltransferase
MFVARIKLPPSLSETDIAAFMESQFSRDYPLSIRRDGPDDGRSIWIAEWHMPDSPDPADIIARLSLWAGLQGWPEIDSKSVITEKIPDNVDWLRESYRAFPAFTVGPFFIHGSHNSDPVPDGLMGLTIDAATAFGSGEHGTTKGCIIAMLDMKGRGACPWNILDMGTGSGILGIAAYKLWKSPVLAVDNDEESVRVAARHRDMNFVPGNLISMVCQQGDGFKTREVQHKKPFDLIIANILAVVLKDMAGDMAAVSDDNGFVILSGILQTQATEVLDIYAAHGFVLKNRFNIDEWSTLLLQKQA